MRASQKDGSLFILCAEDRAGLDAFYAEAEQRQRKSKATAPRAPRAPRGTCDSPEVREAIAALLDGLYITEAAERYGMSYARLYSYWTRFRNRNWQDEKVRSACHRIRTTKRRATKCRSTRKPALIWSGGLLRDAAESALDVFLRGWDANLDAAVAEANTGISLREAARRTGVSYETLRRYYKAHHLSMAETGNPDSQKLVWIWEQKKQLKEILSYARQIDEESTDR